MTSRRKKIITFFLATLAVLLVAAALLIPRFLDLNRYHTLIVSTLEEELGGRVDLGHIRWGIRKDIWLKIDGFSVTGATAFPIDFEIPYLKAEVSIISLLSKKIIINDLLLQDPRVVVRLDSESQAETASPPEESEEPSDTDAMLEIRIEDAYLKKGQLALEDALTLPGQKIVRNFQDVHVEGFDILSRKMDFKVSMIDASAGGLGKIKGKVAFIGLTKNFNLENPELIIEAELPSLSVDAVKPYLKESPLGAKLGGSCAIELNIKSDLEDLLNISGSLDITNVAFTDPALWETPLPPVKTKIIYALKFDQDDVALERFNLKMGGLKLNAQALVEDWSQKPLLKNVVLDGKLPLSETIPLVPWAKLGENAEVVRSLLEGGGQITIEKALLPEMNLAEELDLESVFSGLKMAARFSGLSMQPSKDLPALQDIGGSIRLKNNALKIEDFSGRMGSIELPKTTTEITDLFTQPKLAARLSGRLRLGEIQDETISKALKKAGIEKLQGTADADLALALNLTGPEDFRLDGTVKLQDFKVRSSYSPVLLEGLNAEIAITPEAAEITQCTSNVLLPAEGGSPGGSVAIQLSGRVDNWRGAPAMTLRHMRTSVIMLPWLVPIIPWEAFGEAGEMVRQRFLAGGEVTVKNIFFSKLDVKQLAKDFNSQIQNIEGEIHFADVNLPNLGDWDLVQLRITGEVKLEKGQLIGNSMTVKSGLLVCPDFDFRATRLEVLPNVTFNIKGPLRSIGREDKKPLIRLKPYGLRKLTFDAYTDLAGRVDLAKPEDWDLSGTLTLNSVNAEAHPSGVVLRNLRGEISLERKESFDINISEVSGFVNQSKFRINGQLSKVGKPEMLVAIEAVTEKLNLRDVAALTGPLKKMDLSGLLDMDMYIYLPCADPQKTQLKGNAKLAGFCMGFPDKGIIIKNGNMDVALSRDLIRFRNTSFLLNDQKILLTGQVKNPAEPDILLEVKSPNLNLNRLIPPKNEEKVSEKKDNNATRETKSIEKTADQAPNRLISKTMAQVNVAVQQGRFRDQEFQNLLLKADYEKGLFKTVDVNMDIAEGQIHTTGVVDLRDPARGRFTLDPDVNKVKLEHLSLILGKENPSIYGALTLAGHLEGHFGENGNLPKSLSGNLQGNVGAGRLTAMGPIGSTLSKMLGIVSVEVVQIRKTMKDLRGEGMSFNGLNAEISFDEGTATIEQFIFDSRAMDFVSYGTADLVNRQLDLKAELQISESLDKVLGMVPLVGKATTRLTKVYLDVKGPWADPKIGLTPTRQVTAPIKELLNVPKNVLDAINPKRQSATGKP